MIRTSNYESAWIRYRCPNRLVGGLIALLFLMSPFPVQAVSFSAPESITIVDSYSVVPAPGVSVPEVVTLSDTPTVTVTAQVAISAPVAQYSVASMGFSSAGSQVLQVTNIGLNSLSFSSVTYPSGPFAVTAVTCSTGATVLSGLILPSAGYCNLTVTYSPPASGTASASITFVDNAAVSNLCSSICTGNFTQIVSLTGGPTAVSVAGGLPPSAVGLTVNEALTLSDQEIVTASLVSQSLSLIHI